MEHSTPGPAAPPSSASGTDGILLSIGNLSLAQAEATLPKKQLVPWIGRTKDRHLKAIASARALIAQMEDALAANLGTAVEQTQLRGHIAKLSGLVARHGAMITELQGW